MCSGSRTVAARLANGGRFGLTLRENDPSLPTLRHWSPFADAIGC